MQLTGLIVVLSIAGQTPKAGPPGSLSSPPIADPSPTAWSCTVETLSSGKDCVFESEAAQATDLKAQEAQNIRFAKEMAPAACGRAVRSSIGKADKKLTEMCQREFAAVAETCGLRGEWPLVDAKGRFAPTARSCYTALAEVLQRTAFAAATASRCCQCLAAACKSAPEKCYRDLARAAPNRSDLACINGACSQECSSFAASAPSAPEPQEAIHPLPTKPTQHGSRDL